MARLDTRFSSINQNWETPANIFNPLNAEFGFTIDLAASKHNTKCNKWFDEDDDAIQQDWSGLVGFLNPPYDRTKGHTLKDWVIKSYTESRNPNCTVVMLIPNRSNNVWYHEYVIKSHEIRLICGRPQFSIAGDVASHGLPLPLAIVVFRSSNEPVKLSSFYLTS